MKIIYFTSGSRHKTLKHVISKSYNIVAVVFPLPKKNSRFLNSIAVAKKHGLPIIYVEKQDIYELVKSYDFDVIVSCGFNYIIEERVISLSKIIAINVHPTLLPKYRGYRSGPYIIMNSEKFSGVTIHKITSEMDKGDILIQRKFSISKFDTTKSMIRKTNEIEGKLLDEALKMIMNKKIKLIKQDESLSSTYNYIREPKDSLIDPNKSIVELYDFIRSCDYENYPAFFHIEGQKVLIKLSREKKKDPFNDLI
tara:strand:+ start:14502 stop:15260 length:759 start_codon:yes stop_codon:yes gene_type:complete